MIMTMDKFSMFGYHGHRDGRLSGCNWPVRGGVNKLDRPGLSVLSFGLFHLLSMSGGVLFSIF